MNRIRNNTGFSLTEVLIAVGIMAVGLVMVAMVFPVGVKLTALTTERTIGAVAADEAFAKIQLYGLRNFQYWPSAQIAGGDPNATYYTCDDFQYASLFAQDPIDLIYGNLNDVPLDPTWSEFRYPSTVLSAGQQQNYHWSALCRRMGAKQVEVTVFVTRKIAPASLYRAWNYDVSGPVYSAALNSPWPKPVPVNVDYFNAQPNQLIIKNGPAFLATESIYFFDDGYTIVDDSTGKIYRLLEVDHASGTLTLQQEWVWLGSPLSPVDEVDRTIWVVPPAVGSDRYPCVGVYQKSLRFDEINE